MTNSLNYNKNLLAYYDENFKKNSLFEYELSNNKSYIKINNNRYLINKESLSNYIYISNIIISPSENGFLIENASDNLLLNKVGENIYLLSIINVSNKINLYSMLYTFMQDFDSIVDISKFKFYFKNNYTIIPLFKNH